MQRDLGDLEEAKTLLSQAFTIVEKIQGPEHPNVTTAQEGLIQNSSLMLLTKEQMVFLFLDVILVTATIQVVT